MCIPPSVCSPACSKLNKGSKLLVAGSIHTINGYIYLLSLYSDEFSLVEVHGRKGKARRIPKTAVTDKCCEGLSLEKVKLFEHPLSQSLGLSSAPKGDLFHVMKTFDEVTNNCILSTAHR